MASFVGGDAAGRHIYQRGSAAGKRVQCNMGAKNHGVIMPDANKGPDIRTSMMFLDAIASQESALSLTQSLANTELLHISELETADSRQETSGIDIRHQAAGSRQQTIVSR